MWYRTAADAGVASAQFKLANAYFAGRGVARDPAQALFWYGRAARQGLPEAQHALGIVLIGGLAGSRDPVEGYKWLILAEKGGDPDSPAVRQKADGELSAADRARAEVLARSFKPVSERPVTNTVPPLSPPTKP
jgi:TPR repeat protein